MTRRILPLTVNTILNEATWAFVREHAAADVRQLALRGCKDASVDFAQALQQIHGWQTARKKLPTWAATEGIVYPPHLNMEQCSSEATARYKLRVAEGLPSAKHSATASRLVDLTGGLGVDFTFMSQAFDEAVYVEREPSLFDIARQNIATLGLTHAKAVCADGTDYLRQLDHATLIFIDPARRDDHGGRTYGISDCTPNILPLLDELLRKADRVLVKLSPMLDWRKAMADVGEEHVEQVHIVATGGECKELLLVLSARGAQKPLLVCVNDESREVFEGDGVDGSDGLNGQDGFNGPISPIKPIQPINPITPIDPSRPITPAPYLYEPNAALMKAGVFARLAARYGVSELGPNSHLFTSEGLVEHFPGRTFRVVAVSTMNKRELKEKIAPLKQANITVRNFPLGVAELRKRLKLSEGGSHFLFATTLANGNHVLMVCQRV